MWKRRWPTPSARSRRNRGWIARKGGRHGVDHHFRHRDRARAPRSRVPRDIRVHARRTASRRPAPDRGDIAFVHERLTKKESNADVGLFLSLIGFLVLVIAIL